MRIISIITGVMFILAAIVEKETTKAERIFVIAGGIILIAFGIRLL